MIPALIFILMICIFVGIGIAFLKGLDWLRARPNGNLWATIPMLLLLVGLNVLLGRDSYYLLYDGVTTQARVTGEEMCNGSHPDSLRGRMRLSACFYYEFGAVNVEGHMQHYSHRAWTGWPELGHYPRNSLVWITYAKRDPSNSRWPPVSTRSRVSFYYLVLIELFLGGVLGSIVLKLIRRRSS